MNSICANPAPRLWLVRHARPLVAPGICYGRLDMQADAQSTADAAQALHLALPADCLLAHSPLRRCRQLAQALQALRPGLASAMDSRLLEMDFGEWEGQPWDALDRSATRAQREHQAEATSYVVLHHFGIRNAFTADYVQAWGATPDTLMAQLALVQKAASHLITAIEAVLAAAEATDSRAAQGA